MRIKTDNEITNPITNGKTKKIILLGIIFLFTITIISMTYLFVLTFYLKGFALWGMKVVLGAAISTNSGGIIYAIRTFFATREAYEKRYLQISKV